MTVKEFAEKYGIDYSIAYNATYFVKSSTSSLRNREYDENELREAVKTSIDKRYVRAMKELEHVLDIMRKVHEHN